MCAASIAIRFDPPSLTVPSLEEALWRVLAKNEWPWIDIVNNRNFDYCRNAIDRQDSLVIAIPVEAEARNGLIGILLCAARQIICVGGLVRNQRLARALQQTGIDIARGKIRMLKRVDKKRGVVFNRPNFAVIQSPCKRPYRAFAVQIMGDHFGNHRVIKWRDFGPLTHACVDTDTAIELEKLQPANARQKSFRRVFGIKPCLHRPTVDAQLVLPKRKWLAAGDAQLPFDQIDTCNLLSDGMFDLQPGVHFHEPDEVWIDEALGRIGDEFYRSSTNVIYGLCCANSSSANQLAGVWRHPRRRGFLNHFLVAALERAIAFEQMDDVAMGVAKHLHLYMTRALDIFLDQDMGVSERSGRLTLARGERVGKVACVINLTHPLPATARDGLNQHGIADLGGAFGEKIRVLICAHIAGGNGHACFGH